VLLAEVGAFRRFGAELLVGRSVQEILALGIDAPRQRVPVVLRDPIREVARRIGSHAFEVEEVALGARAPQAEHELLNELRGLVEGADLDGRARDPGNVGPPISSHDGDSLVVHRDAPVAIIVALGQHLTEEGARLIHRQVEGARGVRGNG
jgi:hypothetical protein